MRSRRSALEALADDYSCKRGEIAAVLTDSDIRFSDESGTETKGLEWRHGYCHILRAGARVTSWRVNKQLASGIL